MNRQYEDKTIGRNTLDQEITSELIDVVEDAVLPAAIKFGQEYDLPLQHTFCLACNAMLISISSGIASINDMNGMSNWNKEHFIKRVEAIMNDAFQEPKANHN